MTTTTVEIPTSVVDAVREARAARDAAMAMAEDAAAAKELDVAAIDTAIAAYAATGEPFSANDLRHVLPEDLPSSLFGARVHGRLGATADPEGRLRPVDQGVDPCPRDPRLGRHHRGLTRRNTPTRRSHA